MKIDSAVPLHYCPSSMPLADLLVLDLCDQRGTYCGKLLADLGATVILVEPIEGSPMRRIGPFHPRATGSEQREASLFFRHFNANKRSIALALDSPEGRQRFLDLAGGADVVLESYAPGKLATLGLAYAQLRQINPRIVLTSITPFGQSGPYRDFSAGDLVAQALGGLAFVNGREDLAPLQGFGLPAYHSAGIWGVIGTLLALLDRSHTQSGQWIDVSIQAAATAVLEHATTQFRATGSVARRTGPTHWTQSFRIGACRDGHIVHSIMGDWSALSEWVAHEAATTRLNAAQWNEQQFRDANRQQLFDALDHWAADRCAGDLAEAAQLRRLPVAALQPLEALLSNEHLRQRRYFFPVRDEELGVDLQQPAAPFILSRYPRRAPRRAPHLGEHDAPPIAARPPAGVASAASRSPRSLEGIRVLDFTWAVAGPIATRILADHGADVVKIEPLSARRDTRVPDAAVNLNRGKRSVAVDMSRSRGVELARELMSVCDVVIDNFSPRVMRNWGLDAVALRRYSHLISIGMSGFGDFGPLADWVSYGPTLHAAAGHTLSMQQQGEPVGWGFSYSDMVAGQFAASAVLVALWHRQRTGEGQRIDLSQFETLISVSGPALLAMQTAPLQPPGNLSQEADAAPHGIYRCAGDDRWCAITIFNDDEWQRFKSATELPELRDARFAAYVGRHRHRTEIDAHVERWTRELPAEEVMNRLQHVGIAAGVVANGEDLCEHDPQLRHRHHWVDVASSNGGFELDGVPLLRNGRAISGAAPAPRVGEHTDVILGELLGYDHSKVQTLRAEGIVG